MIFFIIRENVNGFCVYFFNGIQHILSARVHRLTTLDDIVYAKVF